MQNRLSWLHTISDPCTFQQTSSHVALLYLAIGSGAGLVAKELGSSPSLSLSGLQGSYINCEVTLTVNGKSKTFVPKAICNGKVSDGIYVRPRIG